MKGALLFIGNELISGIMENVNSNVATKELVSYGFEVEQIITIPDKINLIIESLKNLFEKYEFLIISGGLGPTDDDITNLAVAKAFKLQLKEHPEFAQAIKNSSEYKNSQELAIKMAILPEGAIPLSKDFSSAGYLLRIKEKYLFFLPGVPSQFSQLLKEEVIPYLLKKFKDVKRYYIKTLRFFDVNETDLNQIIKEEGWDIKIGYYPVFPEVKLILKSESPEFLEEVINKLRRNFSIQLISEEDKDIPHVIGQLLTRINKTIVVAESCTGGLLSSLITSVSGSSAYFERGFVTYSPKSKIELLGVKPETIEKFDVVSYEVALEMAEGARMRTGVDYALGITGFAGPTGGTSENPVGTVYIGFCYQDKVKAFKFIFPGNRKEVQTLASYTALDILRRQILYGEGFFSYRFARGIKEKTL
ncbi:nicotinamide-nucleotide amidohydrolase family protein [Thermodesulfobacterium hydrogeniphilum]|uniref:nicotinamide-nucleotide amidohydrolase family protein n=1 Tax=Thermodesulfobacterium hydrogeniphilum TaxID=161156 RepID=UPI0005700C8F|nr:nicotinamide-nucleotide amidohydrolase family protein [Thermodesulfobacterium hydrogeniphilum]